MYIVVCKIHKYILLYIRGVETTVYVSLRLVIKMIRLILDWIFNG